MHRTPLVACEGLAHSKKAPHKDERYAEHDAWSCRDKSVDFPLDFRICERDHEG